MDILKLLRRYYYLMCSPFRSLAQALDDLYGEVKRTHGKVQLLVVFIPKHGDDVRARIKHWGDVVTGRFSMSLFIC